MKTKYIFAASLMLLGLASCDKFLDVMPDNRTELDSADKIRRLLVTAYPSVDYLFFNELMSDNNENLGDNNPYTDVIYDQIYSWSDVTEDWFACPAWVWENCYRAIASANQALLTMEEKGGAEAIGCQAEMAEALICRAFSHFILVNTFCMNYNPETSDTDLGIPYMTRSETTLNPKYERGTVAEVYQHIDEDIQAALPYLSDSYYKVPQYHFTRKAANAFAARFYLFYEKWEQAEKYADAALGAMPRLRDLKKFSTITRDFDAWCDQFISPSEKANLLMLGANSIYGRSYCKAAGYCEKYSHTRYTANNEDLFAANIWGNTAGFGSASLYYMPPAQYSGNNFDKVTTWRINEHAQIADAVAETVTPFMFFPALTIDETLLVRAEARVLQGKYEEAAEDLTLWMQNNIKTEMVLTPEKILAFYSDHGDFTYATWDNSTIKKHLNPAFYIGAENGLRECMIQCVLGFRRIEGFALGLRWWDVKRYGIEIWRRTMNANGTPGRLDDVLLKDDPRRAIQLPMQVIDAGLEANPRNK
jgi:hypothetical protein